MLVPFYFGLLNMLSLFISKKFKLTKLVRLLLTTLFSSSIIITLVYKLKLYNWNNKDDKSKNDKSKNDKSKISKKYIYPLLSLVGHLCTYFIIIYLIEPFVL